MTIFVPGWLQGGSYSAQHDRINSKASLYDEGVLSRLDLKVGPRVSGGANLSVDIAVGGCVVAGDDQANQGNYDVFNDAVYNLTGFTAPGSNSRYDIVGIQINDPNAGGAAGNNAIPVRIAGTAAASPVIPAVPNSCNPIAIIGPIVPSTTQITSALIHTAHTGTGPAGVAGVGLCAGFRDSPGTSKQTYDPIAPNGWLIEDGAAVSRTTYARLFEHFGTTFGAGNGSTTFNLPDSRGRVFVALDNQGGSDAARLAAANTLGGSGGLETVTLDTTMIPSHTHTQNSHNHTQDAHAHTLTNAYLSALQNPNAGSTYNAIVQSPGTTINTSSVTAANQAATATNQNTGGGLAHDNMPPYILAYRIVRT
jgi:microcystin-dependent protein